MKNNHNPKGNGHTQKVYLKKKTVSANRFLNVFKSANTLNKRYTN